MKQRDLSGLDFVELLDVAILAEEEAAERYGEFADQMEQHHNVQAARLFREIQAREREHLHRLRETRTARSARPATIEPLHFFDPVEAPPYETAHYRMTPGHIFQVALAAEQRAAAFYKQLTEILDDAEAREMARECLQEETKHVEQVENEMRKLSPAPAGWEEDHDEPMPQA